MAPPEKRPMIPKSAHTLSKLPDLSSNIIKVRLGIKNFNYDEPGELGPTEAKVDPRQKRIEDYFNPTPKLDKLNSMPGQINIQSGTGNRNNERVSFVHTSVLCQTSAFFQTATKQIWRGQTRKPIDLTTENYGIFQQYLQWLYSGRIAIHWCPEPDKNIPNSSYKATHDLLEQYLFGGRMLDPTFQNAVIRAFMDCISNAHTFPTWNKIRDVYKGTMENSPIRKLFLDILASLADKTWSFDNIVEEAGEEFTNDLVATLAVKRQKPGSSCKCKHMNQWACPQTQTRYFCEIPDDKKRGGAPA
ncbi:uncharacterized protein J4E78_002526 [Alternaria triticimaculans]|uniref:uncharacterized protein n=1 Tax=Alternaria triticimaculans TaxID=297637 RepID=UPI0020C24034|nr:uncharacterized protein J4E78_002526 [Alternaria triticimaculans]KAI4668698.1 hypothetical protein J4E78_002526 [Alternaria triticimaculans]